MNDNDENVTADEDDVAGHKFAAPGSRSQNDDTQNDDEEDDVAGHKFAFSGSVDPDDEVRS